MVWNDSLFIGIPTVIHMKPSNMKVTRFAMCNIPSVLLHKTVFIIIHVKLNITWSGCVKMFCIESKDAPVLLCCSFKHHIMLWQLLNSILMCKRTFRQNAFIFSSQLAKKGMQSLSIHGDTEKIGKGQKKGFSSIHSSFF